MNIKCDKCKENFKADTQQLELVISARSKGQKFIMLKCPICHRSFGTDPTHLEEGLSEKINVPKKTMWHCPEEGCTGYASWIRNEGFIGCNECGETWMSERELFEQISKAVARYPYRQSVYKKEDNIWLPVEPEDEPKDYEEKVEQEL